MKTEWFYKTEIGNEYTHYEYAKIINHGDNLVSFECVNIKFDRGINHVTRYLENVPNFTPKQVRRSNSTKEEFFEALNHAISVNAQFSTGAKEWYDNLNKKNRYIVINNETHEAAFVLEAEDVADFKAQCEGFFGKDSINWDAHTIAQVVWDSQTK